MSCAVENHGHAEGQHGQHGWTEWAAKLAGECAQILSLKVSDKEARRLLAILRVEHELATGTAREWDRRAKAALDIVEEFGGLPAAKGLRSVKDGEGVAYTALLRAVAAQFPGMDAVLRPLYEEQLSIAYGIGRNGVASDLGKSVSFNLVDGQAKEWLVDHNLYWVGTAYSREFSQKIADTVREATVEQGLSYQEAARALRDKLTVELVGERPLRYWEVVASAAAVRSRAFGSVESMVQAGVTHVEILNVLDESTCDACNYLDGKTFAVQHAVSQRDRMMEARTPEEAKDISPWLPTDKIVGVPVDELAAMGVVLPQYHGRCRCTVNAYFESEEVLTEVAAPS